MVLYRFDIHRFHLFYRPRFCLGSEQSLCLRPGCLEQLRIPVRIEVRCRCPDAVREEDLGMTGLVVQAQVLTSPELPDQVFR